MLHIKVVHLVSHGLERRLLVLWHHTVAIVAIRLTRHWVLILVVKWLVLAGTSEIPHLTALRCLHLVTHG